MSHVIEPLGAATPTFARELADLWLRVTRAGGSVGFGTEPDPDDVRATAARIAAEAAAGLTDVLILRRDGALVGTVRLERSDEAVVRHRAMLKLLMIDPDLQGQGWGTRLVDACIDRARDLGVEQLYLSARSATGLEEYYAKLGWTEVGRFPGGVRVAPEMIATRCGSSPRSGLSVRAVGRDPNSPRGWRPFWVHQGAEYLLGLVLVSFGVQSPTPTFPVLAGGLMVLNAAVVTGPIGAFRLVARSLHRILDVVVVVVIVAVAAMPFLSIDAASRVTMIVVAVIMAFLWASTNFDTRREAAAKRDAVRLASASERSEAIGRTAGRLVARAGQYAKKRRDQ